MGPRPDSALKTNHQPHRPVTPSPNQQLCPLDFKSARVISPGLRGGRHSASLGQRYETTGVWMRVALRNQHTAYWAG